MISSSSFAWFMAQTPSERVYIMTCKSGNFIVEHRGCSDIFAENSGAPCIACTRSIYIGDNVCDVARTKRALCHKAHNIIYPTVSIGRNMRRG